MDTQHEPPAYGGGASDTPTATPPAGDETDEHFFEAAQEAAEAEDGEADEFDDALKDALEEVTIEKDPVKAKQMKDKGNLLFQARDYYGAVERYTMAIRFCPYDLPVTPLRPPPAKPRDLGANLGDNGERNDAEGGPEQGQNEEKQEEEQQLQPDEPFAEYKEELAVYYGNRAACYVSLGRDQDAVDDCTKALKLKPAYMKVLLRRAQASERLDKLEDALRDYKKVVELDPSVREARDKIPGLERVCAERMEKLKNETLGKLKELGNSFLSNFGMSVDNFKCLQDPNTGSYSISFQK